ncbi:MAG: protein kinase [Deltaproteobacteria bacterium]|nr:protein kinase [Deltaproteobacteria bacterium]
MLGEHGRGGLGRVMRARDTEIGRDVAVKELLHRDRAAEARFVGEALITARLEHPGIVPVYESGRWPDGTPFYAMKLVSGRSLRELIRAGASFEQRVGLVANLIAVVDAIAYAHSRRVIHRDLKPANVIVGDFGETVVIDWGIAKVLSDTRADGEPDAGPYRAALAPELTAAGTVLGTPAYMAPEQASGEPVDERADVYALGAILCAIVTGHSPTRGEIDVRLDASGAPADLRAIVRKATQVSPSERYASAKALAADLRAYQRGQRVEAHHYTARERARRWLARHRAVVRLAAVALVALVVAITWAAIGLKRERDVANGERDRAEQASAAARRSANARLLAQADALIARDPSAALTALRDYPPDGDEPERRQRLAAEADGLGVARWILRGQDAGIFALAPIGEHELISLGRDGVMDAWDLAAATSRRVADHLDGPLPAMIVTEAGTLVVARASGTIALIDPHATPALQGELTGHQAFVYDLALSRDRRRLVSTSDDHTVRVWDLATRRELARIDTVAAIGRARLVGASDVVGCGLDGVLRRWHLDSHTETALGACDVALEMGSSMALSADERWLAVPDAQHAPVLYDLVAGTHRALPAFGAPISEIALGHGVLAAASLDGDVRYHDLATGELLLEDHHEGAAYRVAIGASGYAASVGEDGVVRVMNLDSGLRLALRGHGAALWSLAFSPSGGQLITGDLQGETRVWQLPDLGVVGHRAHHERVLSLAATGQGDWLVSSSRDGTVAAWNWRTDEIRATSTPDTSVALVAAGATSQVALATDDGRLLLWDPSAPAPALRELRPRGPAVLAARWAGPDTIVVGDTTGAISACRLDADRCRVLAAIPGSVSALAVAANAQIIAVSTSGEIAIIDMARAAVVARVGHAGRVMGVASAPDGSFVTGGDDGQVERWHRQGSALASRVLCTGAPVRWLGAGPGDVAIAEVADGSVCVAAGDQVTILAGVHQGEVRGSAASPDGQTLFTGGEDGRLVVWDSVTHAHAVVRGHRGYIGNLVLVDDGRQLVSSGLDGFVRRWPAAALRARLVPRPPPDLDAWLATEAPHTLSVTSTASPQRHAIKE